MIAVSIEPVFKRRIDCGKSLHVDLPAVPRQGDALCLAGEFFRIKEVLWDFIPRIQVHVHTPEEWESFCQAVEDEYNWRESKPSVQAIWLEMKDGCSEEEALERIARRKRLLAKLSRGEES